MNMEEIALIRLEAHLEKSLESQKTIGSILEVSRMLLGTESTKIHSNNHPRNDSSLKKYLLPGVVNNDQSPNVHDVSNFLYWNVGLKDDRDSDEFGSLYKIVLKIEEESYDKFLDFLSIEELNRFENGSRLERYALKVLFFSLLKSSCDRIGLNNTLAVIDEAHEIYDTASGLSLSGQKPIRAIFNAIEYCSENQEFPFEWLLSQAFQVDLENNSNLEKVLKIKSGV